MKEKIQSLNALLSRINKKRHLKDKCRELSSFPAVAQALVEQPKLQSLLDFYSFKPDVQFVLKSILALEQGGIIFQDYQNIDSNKLNNLICTLKQVQEAYQDIGGIIGYHLTVLKLIEAKVSPTTVNASFLKPEGPSIAHLTPEVRQMIRYGIEHLSCMGEIYPVGGAGDRLSLKDEISGKALPAAQLLFEGRTLLEGLLRDIQAREYLAFKLMGKQVFTPIALMTSYEKDNHPLILKIFETHNWFDRPRDSFRFFIQPLVPVITVEGNWAVSEALSLILKPGGHGVMWKLAKDAGVFQWFEEHGRDKVLVRQINNPIAGTDYGLLAFVGLGCQKNHKFGFASCFRVINAAEGMNVLVETYLDEEIQYKITNIEYTDFKEKGIHDEPMEPGSLFSQFPANTNILFADLPALQGALKKSPLPGMLVNMKLAITCLDQSGTVKEVKAGRLETMMQNIADEFVDSYTQELPEGERDRLSTYITFNERRKTISVTKKSWEGGAILETPEGCLYELLQNNEELLSKYCQMKVPAIGSPEEFVQGVPPFLFTYHPALGPLFEVIAQKIRKGSLTKGSEWRLEIADVDIENLQLTGSLQVIAQNVMGHLDVESGHLVYGNQTSKCSLKNVVVKNRGIDEAAPNIYWKNQIQRHESLVIQLGAMSEFYAENITFDKGQTIVVPDFHRATAIQSEHGIQLHLEAISQPGWHWEYVYDNQDAILLKKRG